MSLKDKEYESYRRVSPGRVTDVRGRPGALEHEEYAQAVVGSDGAEISMGVEALLGEMLYELRMLRVSMTLAGTAADIPDGVERRL